MERFVAYWQATTQFLGAPGKPSKRKPVAKLMLCYRLSADASRQHLPWQSSPILSAARASAMTTQR